MSLRKYFVASHLQQFAEFLDFDLAKILVQAGIDRSFSQMEQGGFTAPEFYRTWEIIEKTTGRNDFGVLVAQQMMERSFAPCLYSMSSSPNLQVASERLSLYKKLTGPFDLQSRFEQHLTLDFLPEVSQVSLPVGIVVMEIILFIELARKMTGKPVFPIKIELAGEQSEFQALADFYNCEIEVGKAHRITFSTQDAALAFHQSDSAEYCDVEAHLKQALLAFDNNTGILEQVRVVLIKNIPAGIVSIGDTAKHLAMSVRGLQRALKAEGYRYQTLLNEVRKELAIQFLTHYDVDPIETSFLLGYQEPNSFLRAFKTWTGIPARHFQEEYRLAG